VPRHIRSDNEPEFAANDVLPLAEGSGKNGTLVITSDDPQTGFDTTEIGGIIDKLFGNA
jgi:hypothetical protein